MEPAVFGWRISRVVISAALFTLIVFRSKFRSSSVSARSSPARIPVIHAREKIVLNGSRASSIIKVACSRVKKAIGLPGEIVPS